MVILHPKKTDFSHLDKASQQIMLDTIAFFENKGKSKLCDDDRHYVWYDDFLSFVKEKKIFATLMTPSGYGEEGARWDTSRIAAFAEILGFYGLCYWYTYQVSSLGICPIWIGGNEDAKKKAATLIDEGNIFAFGLSEKEHGADIYSSSMKLSPDGNGNYIANGTKYYIGNGNKAAMVSVFGKMSDSNEYVFFTVDSHHPNYKLECCK